MPYDEAKFKEFNAMLKSDIEVIVVHHPEVLGDHYFELVENLNRIADSGKQLSILPRSKRTTT